MMGGGLSGRGALAGVVGEEAVNVLTITFVVLVPPPPPPSVPEVSSIMKLETVTWGPGVWGRGSLLSRVPKSNKQETASKSISSFCSTRCLTDLLKGETE